MSLKLKVNAPAFVLYDGRAKDPDEVDRATVLDSADDEQEARREGATTWKGYDAIWYEGGNPRWDIPPAQRTSL